MSPEQHNNEHDARLEALSDSVQTQVESLNAEYEKLMSYMSEIGAIDNHTSSMMANLKNAMQNTDGADPSVMISMLPTMLQSMSSSLPEEMRNNFDTLNELTSTLSSDSSRIDINTARKQLTTMFKNLDQQLVEVSKVEESDNN